jgi:simple sugar transport system ATP-binding protein
VILARELASKANFIVFSEPTWGLDVASSEFIYEKILEIRKQGVAVLLISSNLDEILSLADTVVVMFRGRIAATLANTREVTRELIGEYMIGLKDDSRLRG